MISFCCLKMKLRVKINCYEDVGYIDVWIQLFFYFCVFLEDIYDFICIVRCQFYCYYVV